MVTKLQALLRDVYFGAWQRRNCTNMEIGQHIFALQRLRERLKNEQVHLENIAVELKGSGWEKADDYLDRIWPLSAPSEQPVNPSSPIQE